MKNIVIPFCTLLMGTSAVLADESAGNTLSEAGQDANTYVEGANRLPSTYVEGSKRFPSTYIYDPSAKKDNDSWWSKIRANGSIQSEFLIPYDFKGNK
ncbi:MAG: hypothetical protein K2O47_08025, partial [Muribaculaceae bacterium]|nr:hypothetical protein [Muribaculaceae bacterium]